MRWLHSHRATRDDPAAVAYSQRTGSYEPTGVLDLIRWWWQHRTCTFDQPCTPPRRTTGPAIAKMVMSDTFGMEWPPREYRECQRGHFLSRERLDWACENLIDQARWDREARHVD